MTARPIIRFGAADAYDIDAGERCVRCPMCNQRGYPIGLGIGHGLGRVYSLKCAYCTALSSWEASSRHVDVQMNLADVESALAFHRRVEIGFALTGLVVSVLPYFTQQLSLAAVLPAVCCGVAALVLGRHARWRRSLVLEAWDRLTPDPSLTFDGLFERDVQ